MKTYIRQNLLVVSGVSLLALVLSAFVFNTHNKHSYLALGDAYTIGEGVQELSRWPSKVEKVLEKDHKKHVHYPEYIARKGWKTTDLLARLNEDVVVKKDVVTLMIGANDHFGKHTIEQFTKDFKAIMKKSLEYTGGNKHRLVVLSIPDWTITPFAKQHNHNTQEMKDLLTKYNAIIKKECIAEGCPFVDITDISKKAETDDTYLEGDKMHPSDKMYDEIAKRVAPVMEKALEK